MPFSLVSQDITTMKVDAIVNAANPALEMGGGVCGAIFRAAGIEAMQQACRHIGGCAVGQAVITDGFALPARYVIHTPGPVWRGGDQGEREQLHACYTHVLQLAVDHGVTQIAFPLISSGLYGFPHGEALHIATQAIRAFLDQEQHDLDVYLIVYDRNSNIAAQELLDEISRYLDAVEVTAEGEPPPARRELLEVERQQLDHPLSSSSESASAPVTEPRKQAWHPLTAAKPRSIQDVSEPLGDEHALTFVDGPMQLGLPTIAEWIAQPDESFSQTLLRLIDERGLGEVEVYKRANLDRKLFSKIRSNQGYMPSKKTALALAIALRLNGDECSDLLARAGYALSRSQRFDLIVTYFIERGQYDLYQINEVLFHYDQPLLGG